MQPSIPVFVVLFCAIFRIEKMTFRKIVGIFFSMCGAIVVVVFTLNSGGKSQRDLLIGNALLLIQCISYSLLIVIQKPIVHKYPSVALTCWYYAFGSLLTILVSFYYVTESSAWPLQGPLEWLALLYAIFFATAFTYCCVTWANAHVPTSHISVFATLQPFSTCTLSVLFLHEKLILWQLFGGGLIIIGLFITLNIKQPPKPVEGVAQEHDGTKTSYEPIFESKESQSINQEKPTAKDA